MLNLYFGSKCLIINYLKIYFKTKYLINSIIFLINKMVYSLSYT
jgi:hypothetical protein